MLNALGNLSWSEGLKLRRSRAPLLSALACAMLPVTAALLVIAARDPARGWLRGMASPEWAGWPGYFQALALASALGMPLIFGLLMIWIFGREHADRTAKELLTLPIPRELLPLGKVLVAGLWCVALQLGTFLLALALGGCLGLPMGSAQAIGAGFSKLFWVGAMALCLSLPFGLAANLSRGVMAAVGLLFMGLFFALVMGALGWGACFPWSVPLLFAAETPLGRLSYGFVIFTGCAALLGSMAWWRRADQR